MANSLTTDLHIPSNKKPYSGSPLSQGKRTRQNFISSLHVIITLEVALPFKIVVDSSL